MQRVQAVKITLADGTAGLFYGPVLVDDDALKTPPEIKDVTFEAPRVVSNIEPV